MAPKREQDTATMSGEAKKLRKAVKSKVAPAKPSYTSAVTTSGASRKKRNITTSQATRNAKPGLFRLPADLRNRIYEEALLIPTRITLKRKVLEPPLLRTCHQIRDEAHPMWYLLNSFSIVIASCRASRLIKFIRRIDSISVDAECDLEVGLQGEHNGRELMKWCKVVWEDTGIEPIEVDADGAEDWYAEAVVRALGVAKRYRSETWEKCQEQVKHMLRETSAGWY